MSIPNTPIVADEYQTWFVDGDGELLKQDDIARDLTEYYTLLKKQEECDHSRNVHFSKPKFYGMELVGSTNYSELMRYETAYCPKCGAKL